MDDLDSQAVSGTLGAAYLERRRAIDGLLDELATLALRGEDEAVRERVRAFAEADRRAFFAVALALTGSDRFYGDVEAELDVAAADALRELGETYADLADQFHVVRLEVGADRHNPVTGLDVTTSYHAEQAVPLVSYAMHSGDVALTESTASPAEVLETATYLVEATNDALEAATVGDHRVATDELSELIDRREELESELSVLRDRLDALRGAPTGDG